LTAVSASARVLMTLVNNVMLTKRLDSGALPLRACQQCAQCYAHTRCV
jgi:hypothetical protein